MKTNSSAALDTSRSTSAISVRLCSEGRGFPAGNEVIVRLIAFITVTCRKLHVSPTHKTGDHGPNFVECDSQMTQGEIGQFGCQSNQEGKRYFKSREFYIL